jgi:hypothetical protein
MSDSLNNSTALTPPANGSNLPPDVAPLPSLYVTSAVEVLKQTGAALARAVRGVNQAYNTAAAILFAVAEHDGVLEVSNFSKGRFDPLFCKLTKADLVKADDSRLRKANGVERQFNVAVMWIEQNLNVENMTARNVVELATRLARMDYTLADFNGVFGERDGAITLEMAEPREDMHPSEYPGFWKIKPEHVARIRSGTKAFHMDATLTRDQKVNVQGKEGVIQVPSDIQRVALVDRQFKFFVGPEKADKTREEIAHRVGINTFREVTTAIIDAQATAAQAAKDKAARDQAAEAAQAKLEADKKAAGDTGNGGANREGRPEGEGEPARVVPGQDTVPGAASEATGQAAPKTEAAQPSATPEGDKPKAEGEAAKPSETPKPDASESERRVAEDRQREDSQKLEEGMDIGKALHILNTALVAPRLSEDPNILKAVLLLHARTTGLLTALGFTNFLKNPVGMSDAIRKMQADSITPKTLLVEGRTGSVKGR